MTDPQKTKGKDCMFCGKALDDPKRKKYHPQCFVMKELLRSRQRFGKKEQHPTHECRCGVCGKPFPAIGRPRKHLGEIIPQGA